MELGPLRILDLFALLILALHFAPWLRRHLPPFEPLQTMGRASLQVFVAHLALALLLLAWLGEANEARSWLLDALRTWRLATYDDLVAVLVDGIERRSAAARHRLRQASAHLAKAGIKAGAQRSRAAIGVSVPVEMQAVVAEDSRRARPVHRPSANARR